MKALLRWIARSGEVTRYAADYQALEGLFQGKKDVWNFSKDPYESARFDAIVDIVRRLPHASILEVGCAEGHLTRRLCDLGAKVTAFDVSPTAVERARQAAPAAEISVGRMEDVSWVEPFDIVVCSETIYYLKDVPAAVSKLNTLGRFILVTYTLYEKHNLDPIFSRIPAILYTTFKYLKFFESGRLVNWRGIRIVLWWSGAASNYASR